MGIFRKLAWFFRLQKRRYLVGVVFLVLTAFTNLVIPRSIGQFADWANQHQLTWPRLGILLGLITIAGLLQYWFRYIWRNQIWGGAADLERQLRGKLFQHYLAMDDTFFKRHRIGDLMARCTNDISAVQNVAGVGILTLADSIITGGTTIIAMIVLVNWKLTLIAILPLPFLALMAKVLGDKLHANFAKSQAAFAQLSNKTQESMTGIKVIKTLGQEEADIADFNKKVEQTININRHVNRVDALFDPLTSIIIGLTYVITIVYGSHLVLQKQITIGQLIAFVGYINALIWPMFAIGRLFNVLERGNASYDRIQALLAETALVQEPAQAQLVPAQPDLVVDIQSFHYPDSQQLVLQKINFQLPFGKTLGIVGRIGSGKSTLVKLLLRRFDNYQGQITLGGIDLRKLQLDSLRASFSYVPQENFLFSTTIENNIRFGNYQSPKQLVIAAAQVGAIDPDIAKLPAGYQTMVGEKGMSLSGGQQQRLALARALLPQPAILILDDSTSALDAKTEVKINHNLRQLKTAQSKIIISQRLRSVMDADEILVLDQGKIIQRGRHAKLIQTTGWYAQMWQRQQLNLQK
ncbi:ATP-binding cassette domain-containing protein [Lactobacillus sp. DCY120]|uniref:ATP-binding cassette domain-containing protein n=1 Tax=Bombilactobacillus apium TaxID=2675299 RepID=A0A850R4W9_9LACO|nr:ABC transporter transmembrane domain-containing protein [Bombilactobacillus apium]NVY97011.1 ATP-binding cassette domain-containing protein [Bombilactobacillus apium]